MPEPIVATRPQIELSGQGDRVNVDWVAACREDPPERAGNDDGGRPEARGVDELDVGMSEGERGIRTAREGREAKRTVPVDWRFGCRVSGVCCDVVHP